MQSEWNLKLTHWSDSDKMVTCDDMFYPTLRLYKTVLQFSCTIFKSFNIYNIIYFYDVLDVRAKFNQLLTWSLVIRLWVMISSIVLYISETNPYDGIESSIIISLNCEERSALTIWKSKHQKLPQYSSERQSNNFNYVSDVVTKYEFKR